MPTLHIEHSISDYPTWKAAFGGFAAERENAGVRRHHIQQLIDDPNYIVIDLDFDTAGEAKSFLAFLQSKVWASPGNAPGARRHPTGQDPAARRQPIAAPDLARHGDRPALRHRQRRRAPRPTHRHPSRPTPPLTAPKKTAAARPNGGPPRHH